MIWALLVILILLLGGWPVLIFGPMVAAHFLGPFIVASTIIWICIQAWRTYRH